MPRLTVFYCTDGEIWLDYITNWLKLAVEQLTTIPFDLNRQDWQTVQSSDFLVILITPEFLTRVRDYLDGFNQTHHMAALPCRTVGLYCGLNESDISEFKWNDFDQWKFATLSEDPGAVSDALTKIKSLIENPPLPAAPDVLPAAGTAGSVSAGVEHKAEDGISDIPEEPSGGHETDTPKMKKKLGTKGMADNIAMMEKMFGERKAGKFFSRQKLKPSDEKGESASAGEADVARKTPMSAHPRTESPVRRKLSKDDEVSHVSDSKPVIHVTSKPDVQVLESTTPTQPELVLKSTVVPPRLGPMSEPEVVKKPTTDISQNLGSKLPAQLEPELVEKHSKASPLLVRKFEPEVAKPRVRPKPVKTQNTPMHSKPCEDSSSSKSVISAPEEVTTSPAPLESSPTPRRPSDDKTSKTVPSKKSVGALAKQLAEGFVGAKVEGMPVKPLKPPKITAGKGTDMTERKQRFEILPNKDYYVFKEEIIISLSEPATDCELSLSLENRRTGQRASVAAARRNDYTFTFTLECNDLSPGEIHVFVHQKKACLGSTVIKYASQLDILYQILSSVPSPVEMMCGILNLDSSDTAALDSYFVSNYYRNLPKQNGPFCYFDDEPIEDRSDKTLPTLLHLAAKYGLHDFAAILITFPGSNLAYQIENTDGDSPKDIAEKENQTRMVDFFTHYEEAYLNYEQNQIYELVTGQESTNSGLVEESIYNTMENIYPVESSHYDFFPTIPTQRQPSRQPITLEFRDDLDSDDGPDLPEIIDEFKNNGSDSDDEDGDDYLKMDEEGAAHPAHLSVYSDNSDHDYLDVIDDEEFLRERILENINRANINQAKTVGRRRPPPPPPDDDKSKTLPFTASDMFRLDPGSKKTGYSSSLDELVLMQEEFKKQMFSEEQTLLRFDEWKREFNKGDTQSFRTRVTQLDGLRKYFTGWSKKPEDIGIIHCGRPISTTSKQEDRAPPPPPRIGTPALRTDTRQRSSSRSASTLSSDSRMSNLSVTDSGHGGDGPSDFYEDVDKPQNVELPPPLPTRVESAMPLPGTRRAPPPPRKAQKFDEQKELENIRSLGPPPKVPPRNY